MVHCLRHGPFSEQISVSQSNGEIAKVRIRAHTIRPGEALRAVKAGGKAGRSAADRR